LKRTSTSRFSQQRQWVVEVGRAASATAVFVMVSRGVNSAPAKELLKRLSSWKTDVAQQ
jgi:hypothetical protein